jgi:hypothetical protein
LKSNDPLSKAWSMLLINRAESLKYNAETSSTKLGFGARKEQIGGTSVLNTHDGEN